MEFLAKNWLYFVSAGLMAFVMFKRGGCCGDNHKTDNNTNIDKEGNNGKDKRLQ